MTGAVYFVDEDNAAYEAWTAELEFRGLRAVKIATADAAYELLRDVTPDDVGLVIIDVMLAVHDAGNPQFTTERTDGYLETGLCLLEDLAEANPSVFPGSAVLLTNTITETTLQAAHACSERFEVPLWQKSELQSPLEFGDKVVDALKSSGGAAEAPA